MQKETAVYIISMWNETVCFCRQNYVNLHTDLHCAFLWHETVYILRISRLKLCIFTEHVKVP